MTAILKNLLRTPPAAAACLAILAAAASATAADNPYLAHRSGDKTTAAWSGSQWGDEIKAPTEEGVPLKASVSSRRLAQMPWGQIVRYKFDTKGARDIPPLYLLVREDVILELVSDDMEHTIAKIAGMTKPPRYTPTDVRAVSAPGSRSVKDGSWTNEIKTTRTGSTYLTSHRSGHFRKFVWRRGAGLVEYAEGSGARRDGFRLKVGAAGWGAGGGDSKFDYEKERIGDLSLGATVGEVQKIMKTRPRMGKRLFQAADGMWVQTWNWPAEGIDLLMASPKENGASTVASINLRAPCKLRTQRWIGIGDTEDAVRKAYGKDISGEFSTSGHDVVVGSIYGGLIFYLDKGKVARIFLGAAAE